VTSLFVETQFGLSGQSTNFPIESGLVPAQLVNKIKIKQIIIFEIDSSIGGKLNSPII
jgi:hypothetical protein